ncbi:MAG: hypothetical protein GWP19_07870 [Planctomycetia bacterium]|nr:hypothetical protein [Planctomycetia bacterium]
MIKLCIDDLELDLTHEDLSLIKLSLDDRQSAMLKAHEGFMLTDIDVANNLYIASVKCAKIRNAIIGLQAQHKNLKKELTKEKNYG